MRIVSKFNDYYDIGLSFGIDSKRIYVRNSREVNKKDYNFSEIIDVYERMFNFYYYDYRIKRGAVAFCGKVYPFYTISDFEYDCSKLSTCNFKYYFYSYKSFEAFVNKSKLFKNQKNRSKYFGKETVREKLLKLEKYHKTYKSVISKHEFDISYIGKRISDDVFIQTEAPIILIYDKSKSKIILNPILRDLNFASIIDPYTAFQELSMFIGSNLVKQVDPSENFSDNMKRDIAGFDEWSFRKKSKRF